MADVPVRAPFPWFGGKRRVAPVVWRAFGADVPNYIEPFAGSLAVLLGRPGGAGKIETVNDRDRYLANFFRAVMADPYAVASYADWPVNEADLHARHKWLVNQHEFRELMHTDPDFYDAKIAGWWVWGLCQWIGGGWCVEPRNHKHPRLDGIGKGVHSAGHLEPTRQLPNLAIKTDGRVSSAVTCGTGIHSSGFLSRKLHHLAVKADGACAGRGIHSDAAVESYSPGRRPDMSHAGQGVHLPSLGNDRGIHGVSVRGFAELNNFLVDTIETGKEPPVFEWFVRLANRLRRVRVACGDWKRVLGTSVLGKGKNVGGRRPCAVFLDPPYSHEFRDPYLYSEDDPSISAQVREWALEHGDDPDLRIALCGYEGEHEMPQAWQVHVWKGARGYAGADNENRSRERIWFSPHCLPLLDGAHRQASLLVNKWADLWDGKCNVVWDHYDPYCYYWPQGGLVHRDVSVECIRWALERFRKEHR